MCFENTSGSWVVVEVSSVARARSCTLEPCAPWGTSLRQWHLGPDFQMIPAAGSICHKECIDYRSISPNFVFPFGMRKDAFLQVEIPYLEEHHPSCKMICVHCIFCVCKYIYIYIHTVNSIAHMSSVTGTRIFCTKNLYELR